ncbi:DUF2637 domain-containing protein [Prauserella rugosa]|uniref:Uncharacterized protein DUF2637 n=1 Tax=Prauserella rugosa TaxID=43354 RepID=A0A660CB33_9PSEU|nr:DUF2637 domain-containing protein [Prauserella rugosa]KMS92661.1 hypothetical protein ACZ91_03070 [Streptomyces regensis]TWH15937.1 uncharacterized protein DUF2637 [Prauserella rugosa]TWH16000.1 uncharacterized protein DUF2637 [Prauserella rugosa]
MTDPIPPARQTSSGLWIPGGSNATPDDIRELMHREYDPMSDTAPFDAVDRSDATTPDTPASEDAPASEPEPAKPEKAEEEPGPEQDSGTRKREPIVRPAVARWIDARTEAKTTKRPKTPKKTKPTEEITQRQVITVCVMAAAVSLGAFVLSFDMMAIAAEHYGWTGWLAKLFPVVIDAGAVAGVVMAGLTSNPVFRRNGWALGALTLAASLVFNVTGHEITGQTMAGIPESYAWTSTAAALLVPCLLAVFVHSAASALHQWTAQERAAQQTAAKPAPTTAEVTVPTRSAAPARQAKSKQTAKAVSSEEALAIGREAGARTPAQLRDAILAQGKTPPSRPHLSKLLNQRADWLN